MLPNATVPNEMLPNKTVVNEIFPHVTVPNAIVLLLLHTKWNTFDSNIGLSKQSIAATTWTQQATLLQVPIPKAEAAASGKLSPRQICN